MKMEKTSTVQPTDKEVVRLEAAIDQCLTEIDRLREQMKNDQDEIEKSRAKTSAILAQLVEQ
jgi:hypothetical protein